MTDEANAADGDESASDAAPANKPRFSKRMIIIGAAILVLLLVGGGAALMLGGGSEPPAAAEADAHAETAADPSGEEAAASYVDVPPLIVNLRSADGASRFLKLRFMLVATNPEVAVGVEKQLPLVIDAYQPFLRELRPEDLAGSAAVFRIKEEMLVRATTALGPGKVKDVLIQDLIQQ